MQLCWLPVFSPTRNRRVPAVSQLGETELKMERAEGLLGGKFLLKRQNDGTIVKTKLYVAYVKLNLAITEAALSAVFTSWTAVWMRQNETSDRPGSVPLKVQSANQRRGSRGGQKQPVLSAAPERGRREDMEVHIAAVFSTVNHWYIILWYIICLKWLLVNL